MSDIVQRLRSYSAGWHRCPSGPSGWLNFPKHYEEAAAEIETLRAQLAAAEKELAERSRREPEGHCNLCKTTVWSNQGRFRENDGKLYHEMCKVAERANIAEAKFAAAESHLLTLAEECQKIIEAADGFLTHMGGVKCHLYTSNKKTWLNIGDTLAAKKLSAALSGAATDAAGSLAFAAGLKERKETGNAE